MERSEKKEVLTGILKENLARIMEDFRSAGAEVTAIPESDRDTFRVEATFSRESVASRRRRL
jgi:hypothetical protein